MASSSGEVRASFVTLGDGETLLAAVALRAVSPSAGIFGPDSMSWKINRESALFLGAGRAALLQLAHPWVATALAEHSNLLSKPITRFHNTFRIVFTMIFGSLDQALAAARHLYALHTRIRGEMPEDIAAYGRGSPYQANEINALTWVYATLVGSAVLAYECAMQPLSAAERDQYYAESRTLAGLFGIPSAALPENWEAFAAYNQQMHQSNALGVSQTARSMAHNLLSGAGSWIHPPRWYRALTAAWMPARFREEFGLDFRPPNQRAAESAMRRLPGIYRNIPRSIRFAGPWHEARARLELRPSGLLTHLSNRFWIGQPLLPFSGESPLPLLFCRDDREGRQ
jgi:uncharacterized protein (DUF2236 family)